MLICYSRFLLPFLHIKMVLGMPTKSQRRKALETLPTDLYKSFAGIITRIRECPGKAKLGMQVLMWVHFAYEPLELAELQHALAVEEGDTELDVDNIPSQKALLDCCLGLVLIDKEKTVRFVHYTLAEYFRKNIKKEFPDGCNYISKTCLTYLNFGGLRQHCTSINSLEEKLEEYKFLEYAALFWGNHINQQCNDDVTRLAEMIVDHESDCPPCAIQVLYCNLYFWSMPAKRFSGTHVMAYFALSKYISHFGRVGRYMDLKDDSGLTPLSWAAACGHESIVKILISRGDIDTNIKVDINSVDQKGQTPLSLAARRGHESVVRLLIETDGVDINAEDNEGLTSLSWAALRGHEAIVRLLIERDDVDINARNEYGRTPFSEAAKWGSEDVVRLIERGVDINVKDKNGRTPLLLAAENGCEAVVRLLIEKGAGINAEDNNGRTPFALAAEWGHGAVMRLLIEHSDVDINAKVKEGWTPLSWASLRGDEAVVRLLIETGSADINAAGKDGRTPLSWAAFMGHEAVLQLHYYCG